MQAEMKYRDMPAFTRMPFLVIRSLASALVMVTMAPCTTSHYSLSYFALAIIICYSPHTKVLIQKATVPLILPIAEDRAIMFCDNLPDARRLPWCRRSPEWLGWAGTP